MKQFTCKDMGGVCEETIEGETAEEVMKKGGEHVMSAGEDHAEVQDQIKNSTPEQMEAWKQDFASKWEAKDEA